MDREPVDIREYLRPILSRWWLIAGLTIAATVVTYVYSNGRPKQFRAATKIYVQASNLDQLVFGAQPLFIQTDRNTQNQATLLTSGPVARAVAADLGYRGDPADLAGQVTVGAAQNSDFLTITATGGTGAAAADIANGFARAFIKVRSANDRAEAKRAADLARRQLAELGTGAASAAERASLRERIQRLSLLQQFPAGQAEQLDPAVAPGHPFSPRPKRDALFAAVLSALLGILAAFGLERLDRRVKSVEDLESLFDRPVLAVVPHIRDVAATDATGPTVPEQAVEAFRTLRTSLELEAVDAPLRTILITSALPGEGKSMVARNLALTMCENHDRVAVVDCDLRRPTLAASLGVASSPGLTEVMVGSVSRQEALAQVETTSGELDVLPSGAPPPNPSTVLGSLRFRELLGELAQTHDVVVIDSPPLLPVSDAVGLLPIVDGVLLVARQAVSRTEAIAGVTELTGRAKGTRIVGVVANDFRGHGIGGSGYHGYEYANASPA